MEQEFRHCLDCGEIVVRNEQNELWKICHEHIWPNAYSSAIANGDIDPNELLYCHCGCKTNKGG